MKLFCIPHAGASAVSYYPWKKYLDETIDFIPLELPGHMTRAREPFCKSINEAVYELAKPIKNNIKNNETYAIFGHSMGGLLLYFLYFNLIESGMESPVHLFFSSRWPPYYDNKKAHLNLDNLDESRSKIIKMGGFKKEILNNKQLVDYYMKVLFADYKLIQSVNDCNIKKINTNMTILWSDNEPDIVDEDIYTWKLSAANDIDFTKIKGTHFFPTEDPINTTNIINYTLKKYCLPEKSINV
ncbi:hypothetical protein B4102_3270 [Heyndrickxia sporothermodurans]|uniref:Thioesterase domain-containing protein n=1 Tax=Heyndrickxia sporothermodurans TaxID=46224 RepID=A0A150KWX2_9BACI|nr:thioesterase domain-containing protein [Heyndrickxia sporothermodurans]KYD04424.1 hypothetical protein B4102_3270 [Heyndrickxia sporothermodurans]